MDGCAIVKNHFGPVRHRGKGGISKNRHVTISRTDIPPIAADLVDIGRLKRLRDDGTAVVGQEFFNVAQRGERIHGMLDYFHTYNYFELALRSFRARERVIAGDALQAPRS